jgi:hypothetical protein
MATPGISSTEKQNVRAITLRSAQTRRHPTGRGKSGPCGGGHLIKTGENSDTPTGSVR